MSVAIAGIPPAALAEYARVPIAFEVRAILDVAAPDGGLGGLTLAERAVDAPYVKDYDTFEPEHPLHWAARFDLSRWGIFLARADGRCVGGAAVAMDVDLDAAKGREGVAVLYDIRVAPEARGRGVGHALFRAAEAWAVGRGAGRLRIETQNINIPACRFYARQGCVLGAIHRFAYPDFPDEAQLLWYKDLGAG